MCLNLSGPDKKPWPLYLQALLYRMSPYSISIQVQRCVFPGTVFQVFGHSWLIRPGSVSQSCPFCAILGRLPGHLWMILLISVTVHSIIFCRYCALKNKQVYLWVRTCHSAQVCIRGKLRWQSLPSTLFGTGLLLFSTPHPRPAHP